MFHKPYWSAISVNFRWGIVIILGLLVIIGYGLISELVSTSTSNQPNNGLSLVTASDSVYSGDSLSIWVDGTTSGSATYIWSIDGQVQDGPNVDLISFTSDSPGTHEVSVEVHDGDQIKLLNTTITVIEANIVNSVVSPTFTYAPALTVTYTLTPTLTNTPTIIPPKTITPPPINTPTLIATLTPSPTNSPTLTPTSSTRYIDRGINLREGPGENYPIIDFLSVGTGVEILGRITSGDWFYVDPITSDAGWITALAFQKPVVLTAISVETPPPSPTPTPTPTLAPMPRLKEPINDFQASGARPSLTWEWADIAQYENYYYEVKILFEDQLDPIDVAWTQYPCYRFDEVPEGQKGQVWKFSWEVRVVQGIHGTPKQWSPVKTCGQWLNDIEVWNPGLITETIEISGVSERRSVYVIVEPPVTPGTPPGGKSDGGNRDGSGGGSGGGDD